jgi:hypothetical protein
MPARNRAVSSTSRLDGTVSAHAGAAESAGAAALVSDDWGVAF